MRKFPLAEACPQGNVRTVVVTALMSLVITACGGGDNSGDAGSFDMSSKEGIVQAASLVIPAALDLAEPVATPSAAKNSESVPARAASTFNCDNGGTYTSENSEEDKNYVFDLFDSQPRAVGFSRQNYRNCRLDHVEEGFADTRNSATEHGLTGSNTSEHDYEYRIYGSGNTPYTKNIAYSDGRIHFNSMLGKIQSHQTQTQTLHEVRAIATRQDDWTDSDGFYSATTTLGIKTAPMKVVTDSNGLMTVNGSIQTKTSRCAGGRSDIVTIEPMSFPSEGGTYPVGGQVKISSGGTSVTLTYNSDGSATYQASDGATGTLLLHELLNNGC